MAAKARAKAEEAAEAKVAEAEASEFRFHRPFASVETTTS